jgi:dienelactone hydrolase
MSATAARQIQLPDDDTALFPEGNVNMHLYPGRVSSPRSQIGIIVLPIQGGDYEVSTLFATYFSRMGFQVLRFERRAEWLEASRSIEDLSRLARQYIRDVSRGLDLWVEQAETPINRVGLFGVSMGSMMARLVMDADKRIDAAVLCLGGSPMSEILIHGRDGDLNQYREKLKERLNQDDNTLRAELSEWMDHKVSEGDAVDIQDIPKLLFCARFDRVVPWCNQVRLWHELDQPPRFILPAGHYSSIVFVPWIRWMTRRFFDRHLLAGMSAP